MGRRWLGVGGADVSEQVVWRAGRRAGLCASSAGPTQHGSKWPSGRRVTLWLRALPDPSVEWAACWDQRWDVR